MPPSPNAFAALDRFDPAVREWFASSFPQPTAAQSLGWPAIAAGESTLILAPTGSGKTLTAFLWCIDRIMFSPLPPKKERCRVVYISPLKALAVDVERNLRAPIAGIAKFAEEAGRKYVIPSIAIRTGDTPQLERARFQREPADILITTPESFYLLLTSKAREVLCSVDTVIIDEIHSLVPTKRGAHLAVSLERLDRFCDRKPQRIGLSATQNPLEEVARFLGGADVVEDGLVEGGLSRPSVRTPTAGGAKADGLESPSSTSASSTVDIEAEFTTEAPDVTYRPVTIVDTGERKRLSLRVEVPVEEMGNLGKAIDIPSGPAASGAVRASIWPAIHPRLVELIRAHRSTLIFVNSRRLAERLAGALNELAGEVLVRAHHGSLAREQRTEIEDRLKAGELPALVATSSLELGIDMGAIDLVIQIEAPPSIASGMQRIGRAGHQAGAISSGIVFPKFRGDLVACAAVAEAMHEGRIERTRFPRNTLDVLAQQIVAMTALDSWTSTGLFDTFRSVANFAQLPRSIFDGVLDMLSGLYPSDEFAELRPRLTWNRVDDTIVARPGARTIAIANGGTIPDRGLFGVFLAGSEKRAARVGELDEEMIFESRPGETFILGATTWRIEEITHDRVLVSPAPGEPGKMPFWHGDAAGRSVELGTEIGKLVREIETAQPDVSERRLMKKNDLDELAARNLVEYIAEQKEITGVVPDDRTVLIERCMDELGDWRVCVLTPFGGRVHAPWAMAATAKIRRESGIDVETMWSDDGFVIRFPETDQPPDPSLVIPAPDELETLVVQQLGSTSLFATRFRENAARALLLPRRRAGVRAPLWQQRKRAADLLQVAARFGSFPMILETYRECLLDVFDMPALHDLMRRVENRSVRVVTADTDTPSPFASSLLFRYVANYIYDGDAPLAERRAQALSIDQSQLRELLGDAPLRDLLDADALGELELRLQHLDPKWKAKNVDGIHDLLLTLGDLSRDDIAARSLLDDTQSAIRQLLRDRRIVPISLGGEERLIAIEDASRYRDALGVPLPSGIPERFLQPVADPMGDLVLRYARTHGPFTTHDLALRYRIGAHVAEMNLGRFVARGRIIEGEFRPGGVHREFCESEVLRTIRRRSLAKLRRDVEPVEPQALARFAAQWHGVVKPRQGVNALVEAIEMLQGLPVAASLLETEILPARVAEYRSSDLDTLMAAGEVVWGGVEPLGEHDGRVALYLADQLPLLRSAEELPQDAPELERSIVEFLSRRGASFFHQILAGTGSGFPNDTLDALWSLVWRGVVTNDTFHAVRSYTRAAAKTRVATRTFRSRRGDIGPAGSEGRWSLVRDLLFRDPTQTERSAALANQLLARYGILSRDAAGVESIRGGFSAVYDVLKHLEESGRIRRGYFVEGIAAMQFAMPSALDLLRSLREEPESPESVLLAATDPANPYGSILKWPESGSARGLTRSVGPKVLIVNGRLVAYLFRGDQQIEVFLPEEEPLRTRIAKEAARSLAAIVRSGHRRALLIAEINGAPAREHDLARFLAEEGFVVTAMGLHLRAPKSEERSAGSDSSMT